MATSTSSVRISYDAQGRRVLTHPEAATITRAELVSRAKALAPVLRERARATEDLRHIPQETVDDLTNAGGIWVDDEVVRDANIITSRKPADLPAFMRTIVEALKEVRLPATNGAR